MRIDHYTSYFKNIADSYTPIGSFFEADLFDFETFADNLRGENPATLVLILEPYSRHQTPNTSANIDLISGALVVLDRIDPRSTRLLHQLANAEMALLEIRKRMFLDSHHQACSLMAGLRENTRLETVSLVANEWAGWRMEFSIELETAQAIAPSQWPHYNPYQP